MVAPEEVRGKTEKEAGWTEEEREEGKVDGVAAMEEEMEEVMGTLRDQSEATLEETWGRAEDEAGAVAPFPDE